MTPQQTEYNFKKMTAETMSQRKLTVVAAYLNLTYGLAGPYTHGPPQDFVHLTKRRTVIERE